MSAVDWEKVARARLHPMQVRVLDALAKSGEAESPNQLRLQFKVPLQSVAYHVDVLAKSGLLKLESTAPRRGALEHFYLLVAVAK